MNIPHPAPPKTRLERVDIEPDGPTVRPTRWVFKNPTRKAPGARIDVGSHFVFIEAEHLERVALKLTEAYDAIREQAKR